VAAPRSSAPTGPDRRTIIVAAVVLFVAIAGGVAAVAFRTDSGIRQQPSTSSDAEGDVIPRIIPRPDEGSAPKNAGDRGGWEQLAVFGLMMMAMAGIGLVIFRGGRSARAGRAAWRAAAASGHDGAVDGHGHLQPGPGG